VLGQVLALNHNGKHSAGQNWLVRLVLSILVGLVVLPDSGEGFFHKQKSPAAADDEFKKLGIEKPEKPLRAPDFALKDFDGRRWALKDFKGKVIFVNFWATWCVPCREEMPTMEKLHRELKGQGLEVAAINVREGKKEVRKFVDELGLTFTVLLDSKGQVSEEYGAWAIPLSYFINRQGVFVGKLAGYRRWDGADARAFFQRLLAEKN
jgi:peroxiredoxin